MTLSSYFFANHHIVPQKNHDDHAVNRYNESMSINVQFFASLRETLGKTQVSLAAENSMDVQQVWAQASDNTTMPDNTLCAINMEYVKVGAMVKDGDEVAFFPPVTGG